MKKKIIIGAAAFCLTFGGFKIYEGQEGRVVTNKSKEVFAQTRSSENVEKIIRKELSLGQEYKLIKKGIEGSAYNTDFCFQFESKEKLAKVYYDFYLESITRMDIEERNPLKVLRYTKEQLEDQALKIIDEKFKDIKDQLKAGSKDNIRNRSNTYGYEFVRVINGEEYADNGLVIYISGATGEYTGFSKNWEDVEYNKKTSIDYHEAKRIFLNQDEVDLRYESVNISEKSEEPNYKIMPVFKLFAKNSGVLDASTKKFIENTQVDNYRSNMHNDDMKKLYGNRYGLETEEKVSISKEKAADVVMDAAEILGIETKGTVRSSRLMKEEEIQTVYWNIGIDFEGGNINGVVNARNGKLIGLSANIPYLNKQNELDNYKYQYRNGHINKEEFEEIAKRKLEYGVITKEEFDKRWDKDESLIEKSDLEDKLNEIFKELTGVVHKLKIERDDKDYETVITGFRNENNIPYYKNGIMVSYNPDMQKITGVEFSWDHDLKMEKPQNIISKKQAAEKLYDENGIQRKLIKTYDERSKVKNEKLVLVYIMEEKNNLALSTDGQTLYDQNGKYVRSDDSEEIKDINTSEYKNEIKKILAMGMGYVRDGKFRPSEKINKYEALSWITSGLRTDKYDYLNRYFYSGEQSGFEDVTKDDKEFFTALNAVKLDCIEEGGKFNGNSEVKRVQMAEWIINALGEKKMAQNEKLFGKDGYKKLGEFYGLLNGNNSDDYLTREEAAKIIYDILVKIEDNKR